MRADRRLLQTRRADFDGADWALRQLREPSDQAVLHMAVSRATLTRGRSVAEQLGLKRKRSKYGNVKTVVDGITFDSKAEAKRWGELRTLERAGQIKFLLRQITYKLLVNGSLICKYRADFVFYDVVTRRTIVEDVKGVRTADFVIKSKLMAAIHGITVVEIGVKRKKRKGKDGKRQ
jgi:hypothetical protein